MYIQNAGWPWRSAAQDGVLPHACKVAGGRVEKRLTRH